MLTLKDTTGQVLAKSESDLISVGREDDNTICVNEESVSGYHGVFILIGGRWVYRDNFSTNGSFFNGVALRSGQAKYLKSGDLVRLATYSVQCDLRVKSITDELLVLKGFEQVGVIEIPKDVGELIVSSQLGGAYSDLTVPFSLSKNDLGALTISSQQTLSINGNSHSGNLALLDQDQIDVGEFSFVVCYSGFAAKPVRTAAPTNRDYDPAKKMEVSGKRAVFGAEGTAEPAGLKTGTFKAEMSMSQKLSTIADDEATKRKNKIERSYAAFGVLVLFTTIGFVVFAVSLL